MPSNGTDTQRSVRFYAGSFGGIQPGVIRGLSPNPEPCEGEQTFNSPGNFPRAKAACGYRVTWPKVAKAISMIGKTEP